MTSLERNVHIESIQTDFQHALPAYALKSFTIMEFQAWWFLKYNTITIFKKKNGIINYNTLGIRKHFLKKAKNKICYFLIAKKPSVIFKSFVLLKNSIILATLPIGLEVQQTSFHTLNRTKYSLTSFSNALFRCGIWLYIGWKKSCRNAHIVFVSVDFLSNLQLH